MTEWRVKEIRPATPEELAEHDKRKKISKMRHALSKDVVIGMSKITTRQQEVWVDECTHEGGKKLAPVKDITPFIDYLIEQGWTKPGV